MPEKVLVTGATGKVGTALVPLLLEAGVEVKAGTRRPERARALFGAGVEPVELDYERTETYDAAVMWADRIFLVPPPFDPHADDDLVPFLDWAVSAGTRHLVLLSAMGVEALEWLALRKIELRVERTGVDYTFLRPNWYVQNFTEGFIGEELREGGAFHLSAGDGRVSFVDVRDVAAVAVAALVGDEHSARAYTLTGPEAIDHHEVARRLGAAAGREIRYVPVSDDEMRRRLRDRGIDRAQVDVMVDLLRATRNGERAAVSKDVRRVLGREPRPLAASP